jgi:hypothetical protein
MIQVMDMMNVDAYTVIMVEVPILVDSEER